MELENNDIVREMAVRLLPHFNGLTVDTTEQIIERLKLLIRLNGKLILE